VHASRCSAVLVPTWMTDHERCAPMSLDTPRCSLEALLALRRLLDMLVCDREPGGP
jgi:hypothetical protein